MSGPWPSVRAMPLVAMIDGHRTVSSLLTAPAWTALQQATRARTTDVTLGCGKPGHLRVSPLGLQFFAHNPGGTCSDHGDESEQHLRAKDIIVRAAIAAGWDAQPEVRGDGWTADVLATKGDQRVALEVQWSQQTAAEYAYRQNRYAANAVRCVWFARHTDSIPTANPDLPVFQVTDYAPEMTVDMGGVVMGLAEGVDALLRGRAQYRDQVSGDGEVTIHLYADTCYRCREPMTIWKVSHTDVVSPCGRLAEGRADGYKMFAVDRPEAAPTVRHAVEQITTGPPMADLSMRSTRTSGTSYMAFSCPRCHAVSGDVFIASMLSQGETPLRTEHATVPGIGLAYPHWCLDQGSGHCEPAEVPFPECEAGILIAPPDTGLAEGRHRLSDGAFLDGPAPDDEDSSGALNITIVTPGNLDAMVHRLTHGMTWGG
jgi:hypothetical protein